MYVGACVIFSLCNSQFTTVAAALNLATISRRRVLGKYAFSGQCGQLLTKSTICLIFGFEGAYTFLCDGS